MADVTLTIDGKQVRAPAGTLLIEAWSSCRREPGFLPFLKRLAPAVRFRPSPQSCESNSPIHLQSWLRPEVASGSGRKGQSLQKPNEIDFESEQKLSDFGPNYRTINVQ